MPELKKKIWGLPVTIIAQRGEVLPEDFGHSTNWPLFADKGVFDDTRDPFTGDPIVVCDGDADFTDKAWICVKDLNGTKMIVIYSHFHSMREVMMAAAGLYLSSEVVMMIEKDAHEVAAMLSLTGTVMVESETMEVDQQAVEEAEVSTEVST